MEEILTKAEMVTKYPGEWILIDSPETDYAQEVVRGKVVYHTAVRAELYREAIRLKLPRFAFVHTGNSRRAMAYLL